MRLRGYKFISQSEFSSELQCICLNVELWIRFPTLNSALNWTRTNSYLVIRPQLCIQLITQDFYVQLWIRPIFELSSELDQSEFRGLNSSPGSEVSSEFNVSMNNSEFDSSSEFSSELDECEIDILLWISSEFKVWMLTSELFSPAHIHTFNFVHVMGFGLAVWRSLDFSIVHLMKFDDRLFITKTYL